MAGRTHRLAPLDGLRGIAAVAVVLCHFLYTAPTLMPAIGPSLTVFRFGTQGVQLFFVISGFVITLSMRNGSLRDFVASRVARLFPVYWSSVIIASALIVTFGLLGMRLSAVQIAVNFTMLQSYIGVDHVDGVYWTLAVELAFYVQAAFLWNLGLLKGRSLVPTLLAWLAISTVVSLFVAGGPTDSATPLLARDLLQVFAYIPWFVCGIVALLIWEGRRDWKIFAVAAVAEVAMILLDVEKNIGQLGIVYAALILVVLLWRPLGTSSRLLLFFGEISYALYVLHYTVGLIAIRELRHAGVPLVVADVAAFVMVVALSAAVTRLIDRPLRPALRRLIKARSPGTTGVSPSIPTKGHTIRSENNGGRPIVFVDHTGEPGGAELALPRFARLSGLSPTFLFLAPLTKTVSFSDPDRVTAPDVELSIPAQLSMLRAHWAAHPDSVYLSNTIRAALFVALALPRSSRQWMFLHDGLDAESLSPVKRALVLRLVMPRLRFILPNSVWSGSTVWARYQGLLTSTVYSLSGVSETASASDVERTDGPLRVLSLSRLVEWKGIHTLLEALAIVARERPELEIEATIAGSGIMGSPAYVDRIHAMAKDSKIPITWAGQLENVDIALASHDVLVLASTRPEPFGQVVVQGLAWGLAVLATDRGGPRELITHDESGMLFGSGDADALAKLIVGLAEDRAQLLRLSKAARTRAADFSDVTISALWDRVLTLSNGTTTTAPVDEGVPDAH